MSQPALPIRVLIVDDHPLMRDALASALAGEPDLMVAGAVADGVQALDAYRELRPDVVIMDLMMPRRDGVAATADILAHDPAARILILTSAVGDERLVQALAAGAQGYLLKDAERKQILDGVRRVAAGELFLPPTSAGKLVRAIQQGWAPGYGEPGSSPQNPGGGKPGTAPGPALSTRQLDVLTLAAGGLTDAQIAARLVLSESTVRVHMHHIIDKLHVADRAGAIAWYERAAAGSSDREQ
jgi:DNA-binding NarL/FixJ family response regulator